MEKTVIILLVLGFALASLSAQPAPWKAVTGGALPALATPVGYSPTGAAIFLARTLKSGRASLGWLEAKTTKANLIEGLKSPQAASFDIYTGAGRWVSANADALPEDTLTAGQGSDGQAAYILRVASGGWLIPAAYSAKEGAAVAFIDGQRSLFSSFEVLAPDWAPVSDADAVQQGFPAAKDKDGSALSPFRAAQGSGLHPGKYKAAAKTGWISYGGKEIVVRDPNSEIFIGSGVWTAAGSGLPPGAIQGGYDNDGSPLYMIRAKQAGVQALGKYNAARKEAYIPYGGEEIKVASFEVLCYDLGRNREDSAMLAAAPAPMPERAAGAATPASLVDEAIRRSGLQSVLSLSFDNQATDLSPSRASVSPRDLQFGSAQGSTYGSFDGRGSSVDVDYPRDIGLSRATILLRVKSAFNKTWQAILNNRGWSETNAHFQFVDGRLEFAVNGNTPTNFDLDYGFRPGQWYQIVLVYDMRARSAAIYVDGARAGDISYAATVPYALGSMEVGAWDGEDRFLSGQIDYLHVLNGVMSERDILSSFPTGSGGS